MQEMAGISYASELRTLPAILAATGTTLVLEQYGLLEWSEAPMADE